MSLIENDRQEGYRPGVGLVLLHNKMILLAKKASWHSRMMWDDSGIHLTDPLPTWQSGWDIPQGGIEEGETFEQAIHREMCEELNTDWVTDPLKIELLQRQQLDFPVKKDGREYVGKTYYYHTVTLDSIPDYYIDWVYGKDDNGENPDPLPVSEFGGVLFMSYAEAQRAIQQTRRDRKVPMLMRVLHELRGKNLLH